MSPVAYTDAEAVPPTHMETNNGAPNGYSAKSNGLNGATISPAPTSVDAYRPRGIGGGKTSPLAISHLGLRILTAVCTLIAFAIIASDSIVLTFIFNTIVGTVEYSQNQHFHNFWYFSYLFIVDVVAFLYAVVTLFLAIFMLCKGKAGSVLLTGIFALDQIFSYLLISAATSAATGARIGKSYLGVSGGNFLPKAYAAVAFTFLAFFTLGVASLISGLRVARRG